MENTSGEPCARCRDSGGNSRSLSPAPPIWHPTTQQSQMVINGKNEFETCVWRKRGWILVFIAFIYMWHCELPVFMIGPP
jgi:hypothetical protein